MLMADIGLVANAMTALNVDPDIVSEVTQMLMENADGLQGQVVTNVAPSWFGGSSNAHRIAVNTKMAHQEVEDEFLKLADSLRAYSDAIKLWADDVRGRRRISTRPPARSCARTASAGRCFSSPQIWTSHP